MDSILTECNDKTFCSITLSACEFMGPFEYVDVVAEGAGGWEEGAGRGGPCVGSDRFEPQGTALGSLLSLLLLLLLLPLLLSLVLPIPCFVDRCLVSRCTPCALSALPGVTAAEGWVRGSGRG